MSHVCFFTGKKTQTGWIRAEKGARRDGGVGNKIKGRGLAKDEMEMRSDLRRQGIAVSRVRKERKLFKSEGKVTAEDIAIFSRQLATMLTAGIPMVQAFEIIGVGHDKPAVQKLVLTIKQDIETGNSLHASLAKHPLYFDDLFVNLVEAGEQAGALETVLDKIATYKEKTEALKKKIKKALFYPAAVLAVAVPPISLIHMSSPGSMFWPMRATRDELAAASV